MVDFNRTRQVTTEQPQIKVDAGLKVGTHTFQLTVVDQEGNKSLPAQIKITVARNQVVRDPRLVDRITRDLVTPVPIIR